MLPKTSKKHKNLMKKKVLFNERISKIEHGSSTLLVMSAASEMSRECNVLLAFYSRLAEMVSSKRSTGYNITVARIRRKITFSLVK